MTPGSPEAIAAWHDACREHSIRTAHLNDCPELTRSQHDTWTIQSLTRAMEAGEITVAEYIRLQPIASERELRFAEIARELNIGGLFALAYAGEYPLPPQELIPDHGGPDPIFKAIQAHAAAREAFSATVNPQDAAWVRGQGGDTSDEAMAPAHAAYEIACAAEAQTWSALFEVRPTTLPGVLAQLRHCQAWAPSNDGQAGAPAMEDVFGIIADGLAGVIAPAETDEPLTVESAATLSFQAYTFDASLRTPREWAAEFEDHAIAMHIAGKALRMTKPELMAFIRDANERGNGADEIMMRALTAASETFEGWAKLMHLAGTRYLVAGASVAIEPETEGGGA